MRVQKRSILSAVFIFALLSLGGSALAQDAPPQPERRPGKPGDVIVFEREVVGPGQGARVPMPPGHPIGEDTMMFLSSEMSVGGKVVKGAPYSAQAITENTRTLGDGNKIRHKNTAAVYRDSEGRTRRDQELGAVGPWAMAGEPHQTVFIHDPVANTDYILDPRTRTARKMRPIRIKLAPDDVSGIALGNEPDVKVRIHNKEVMVGGPPPPSRPHAGGPPLHELTIVTAPKKGTTESLGKQTIEGVLADGTRTTVTIPAGEVGNEQPIQIIWEKWYSPELQTIISSKHSDPFVGESVFRLTNIVRGEPARSLFEVPQDYTLQDSKLHTRVIRRKAGGEK